MTLEVAFMDARHPQSVWGIGGDSWHPLRSLGGRGRLHALEMFLKVCLGGRTIMKSVALRSAIVFSAAFMSVLCPSLLAQQEKGDKEVSFQGTVSVPFENPGDGSTGFLVPRFGYYLTRRNFVGIENVDILAKGYQAAGLNLLYRFYLGSRGSRFQPYLGAAPGLLAQWQPVSPAIIVTQASVNAAAAQITNATNLLPATKQFYRDFLSAEVEAFQAGLFCPSINALQSGQCSEVKVSDRKVASGDFQGAGEIGVKFYLNRKFAFETSYRLVYVHRSDTFAQDVYDVSNSTLTPTNYTVAFGGPTRNDGQKSGNVGFKQSANSFILFGFSYVF